MDEHFVQFYEDDKFLVEEVAGFIGTGLWAGDAGVVIASRPNLAQFEQRLSQSGLKNAGNPPYVGQYIAMDAEQALSRIMVDAWPDEQRFIEVIGGMITHASKGGQVRVRAFGEMVALLCLQGNRQAALRLEDLWNNLGKSQSFALLCAYPMAAFSREEDSKIFHETCAAHSHVCLAESFRLPTSQDELHRTIALLQQKANALESEVARRKETERALQRHKKELSDFLDNAVEGMHRVGADGTILWANKAELELLGYRAEEYLGRHIAEFHVDQHVCKELLGKLLGGETVYDYPARLRCKDGSIRHVLIHSNALIRNGDFISTRCLTRDVTDRVRLEQELNKKLQELADLDRRKDEFLAMLGHELRNPLAPIMTSLELMQAYGDDPARLARCRDIIARQVTLMTRLVDDLLDVSRITRGTIELKMEQALLQNIVERAIEIAGPLIDARRHTLTLNLPAAAVPIFGDPSRLAQVLANLLHNAAKYTDEGGSISLDAREEGSHLILTVSDNGIGMDAALRDKVFDLFVQGKDSLARARGGLGLGLTLVRSLVRLHGGSVEAHSNGPGRGSSFAIRLPLQTESTGSAARDDTASTTALSALSGKPRRILIVDDNVDAAESLGELLKAFGHTIHLAHDGANAISAAERLCPDVVILDIGLPAMDGYQVAQHLRAQPVLASSLLVALTGYAQESDCINAREAGFDHHFAKPLDIRKLADILNSMD